MTAKSKITLLIIAICAFFAVFAAFYGAGYITGRQTQKSDCARKIAEMNANASNQIIVADKTAHQITVSRTTAEKLDWLKTNRSIR